MERRNLWRTAVIRARRLLAFRPQLPPPDEFGCVSVTTDSFQDVIIRTIEDVLVVFYTPDVVHAEMKLISCRPKLWSRTRFSRISRTSMARILLSPNATLRCIVCQWKFTMSQQSNCIQRAKSICL